MAFQEAKTWDINQHSTFYVTGGVGDLPTTADFINVGDWVVNINPTMAVGDVLTWVCSSVSGVTPSFTAVSYAGAVKGVKTATAATTVSTTASTVLVDATSAGFTLTLPTMGTSAGQAYAGYGVSVVKIDSTTNPVTIVPVGSSTIDGMTTSVLNSQYQTKDLRATGTANGVWYKITDGPAGVRAAASPQTISTSDRIYLASTAGTITMPSASTWPIGIVVGISAGATVTVTPAAGTVTGVGASITLTAGQVNRLTSDGTNYWVV